MQSRKNLGSNTLHDCSYTVTCLPFQEGRIRYAKHYLRTKDKHVGDVLLWIPSHVCASISR